MIRKDAVKAALLFALSLGAYGCLKPEQEVTGPETASNGVKAGLDAEHGGARVTLPEIDFAALGKMGKDSVPGDTTARAFFELTITGSNMPDMVFRYSLGKVGGRTFEVVGIPAGSKRSFHGRILTRDYQPTHEGLTVTDINSGAYTDIRLYLSKASGSANVCVVIEGQKLPACARDTIPPPPPDTTLFSHCWYVSSDSVSGQMTLYPEYVQGYMGVIADPRGIRLPITTWRRFGDSLSVIVVRPSMEKKWILSGPITDSALWTATGMGGPMESPFLLYGKAITCGDTLIVPPIDTMPPPKDTVKTGAIPSAASSAGEVTLCFEMRFDYAGSCEFSGYAKMSFFAGRITRGNIMIADGVSSMYTETRGDYSKSPNLIRIETISPASTSSGNLVADTLVLDGAISYDRTTVKGEYSRWPDGKKGIWTMSSVVCGNWKPKYADSTCVAKP